MCGRGTDVLLVDGRGCLGRWSDYRVLREKRDRKRRSRLDSIRLFFVITAGGLELQRT